MFILYKSYDLKEILLQLLKKARKNNYKINILCKNNDTVNDLSIFLWNNGMPHWINNDLYENQNHIFLTTIIKPADILIIYYDASFKMPIHHNFLKKIILGNYHNIEGEYWGKNKNGWIKLTKKIFYS